MSEEMEGSAGKKVRLSEVAETYAGATPKRSEKKFFGGPIPWVKSGEVNQSLIDGTEESITPIGHNSSSTKMVPAGTPLMAMYGATAGEVAWLAVRATTNQAVLAVDPDRGQVDPRWLYWALGSSTRTLLNLIQGSGQSNLSKRLIDSLTLSVPSMERQRYIADILDTVDRAIRKTEEVIDKLERIKKGLLHDLLTRGIDENGELRDPHRHPEQFKQTELGLLPKEWEVVRLGQLMDEDGAQNGIYKPQSEYGDFGTRILRIDAFQNGRLQDEAALRRVALSPKERRKYQLTARDIVVNRVNSMSHLGKSLLVPELNEPTVFESNMMRFRLRASEAQPAFVAHYLLMPGGLRELRKNAKPAVAQASINQDDVADVRLPLPGLPEQRRALDRIARTERIVKQEQSARHTMENLKSGLSVDLLG